MRGCEPLVLQLVTPSTASCWAETSMAFVPGFAVGLTCSFSCSTKCLRSQQPGVPHKDTHGCFTDVTASYLI